MSDLATRWLFVEDSKTDAGRRRVKIELGEVLPCIPAGGV
jgi:hypothetical protein